MKKKILLLMGVFAFGLLTAQVGVNTQNPLGVFHVDARANTTGTAVAPINDADDVIVTADGRVGIGTANPQADLHIEGRNGTPAIRLVDGNQVEGRVWTAINSAGVGEWRDRANPFFGQVINGQGDLLNTGNSQVFTTRATINDFSYTLTTAGLYAVEVRFWGIINGANRNYTNGPANNTPVGGACAVHLYLVKNNNTTSFEDQYEGYAHAEPYNNIAIDLQKITYFVTLYARVTAAEAAGAGATLTLLLRSGMSPGARGVRKYGANSGIAYAWGYPKVGIKLIGE